jgi:nucleotide-binding universal stress UspA family protein
MRPVKVLLYVDGSDAAMRAVDRAVALALTGADVLALHVYPPSLDRGMVSHFEIEPEDLDAAFSRMALSVAVDRFAAHGLVVDTLVLIGNRAEVIGDHATSQGFDLVLIGSPGASRIGVGLAEAVRRRTHVTVEAVA